MLYNMKLLNAIEKEMLEIERLIESKYLSDSNIITVKQLEEIKKLNYVLVLDNDENLNEYIIILTHEECEIDIESMVVFTK